jgi:hypothetical protein
MKTPLPSSGIATVLMGLVGLVLASGTLLANGQAFFVPADKGPVDLVYFARVKNARTGRPIEKPPYVTIVDPYSGIILPFAGDGPGHFRSPDVGAAIKEVTAHPIDTRQFEIVVTASGYQTMKVAAVPRQSKGIIELDVRMEPKTTASGSSVSSMAVASRAPADLLPAGCLLWPRGYFSGGANSRPPDDHSALGPRSMPIGVDIPRLRSNTSA